MICKSQDGKFALEQAQMLIWGGGGLDQQIHVQLHVRLACCERAAVSTCGNLGSSKGPCRDRRGARPCTSSTSLRDRPLAYTRVSAYVDYTYVPRVNVWTTTTTGGGWGLEQQAMKSGPPGVQLTTALPSRFPYPGQGQARFTADRHISQSPDISRWDDLGQATARRATHFRWRLEAHALSGSPDGRERPDLCGIQSPAN